MKLHPQVFLALGDSKKITQTSPKTHQGFPVSDLNLSPPNRNSPGSRDAILGAIWKLFRLKGLTEVFPDVTFGVQVQLMENLRLAS